MPVVTALSYVADPRGRDSTILMLQWAIWKHLGPKLVQDTEHMQRLAEALSVEFYEEGMRMPLNDDHQETVIDLQAELKLVSDQIGPVPIPEKHLRERSRKAAEMLYERGWRKFATAS